MTSISSSISVAIVVATGNIGGPIARALLSNSYYPAKIGRVLLLTRDASSESVKALVRIGAEAIQVTPATVSPTTFEGVDVLINALGSKTDPVDNDAYFKAAVEGTVKVYFTSDFGTDYTLWDVDHAYFKRKLDHANWARRLGGTKTKVISVFPGGFMELTVSKFLGMDFRNQIFIAWGDPNQKMTFTALQDVAQTVAQLSVLAVTDPESVPTHVRIMGDAKSHQEIAKIMGRESGETIQVAGTAEDYHRIKAELDEKYHRKDNVFAYLRLLYSSNAADHTGIEHNEIVNPGGLLWTWKTIEAYAKETNGNPGL